MEASHGNWIFVLQWIHKLFDFFPRAKISISFCETILRNEKLLDFFREKISVQFACWWRYDNRKGAHSEWMRIENYSFREIYGVFLSATFSHLSQIKKFFNFAISVFCGWFIALDGASGHVYWSLANACKLPLWWHILDLFLTQLHPHADYDNQN